MLPMEARCNPQRAEDGVSDQDDVVADKAGWVGSEGVDTGGDGEDLAALRHLALQF